MPGAAHSASSGGRERPPRGGGSDGFVLVRLSPEPPSAELPSAELPSEELPSEELPLQQERLPGGPGLRERYE